MYEKTYNKISNVIRGYGYGSQILRVLNKITTSFVYLIYPIALLILGIDSDSQFLKVLLVPGVSFILLSVFRYFINRPRPYEVYDIIPILNKNTEGKSFPSRHVFSVFVIAMTLYYISIPLGVSIMVIGIIIAIVRVLGGVHFPIDVIVGAIIGILSAIIGWNYNMFI